MDGREGPVPALGLLQHHDPGPRPVRAPAPGHRRTGADLDPAARRAGRLPAAAHRRAGVASGPHLRRRVPRPAGRDPRSRLDARAARRRRDCDLAAARPLPPALGVHARRGARGRTRGPAPAPPPHDHRRRGRDAPLAQPRRRRTGAEARRHLRRPCPGGDFAMQHRAATSEARSTASRPWTSSARRSSTARPRPSIWPGGAWRRVPTLISPTRLVARARESVELAGSLRRQVLLADRGHSEMFAVRSIARRYDSRASSSIPSTGWARPTAPASTTCSSPA